MQELIGTAFNTMAAIMDDGTIEPRVEVVLLSSEPRWEPGEGGLVRKRIVTESRTTANATGLRRAAAAFLEQAALLDEVEKAVGQVSVRFSGQAAESGGEQSDG